MGESENKSDREVAMLPPQSQRQRWLKYGANVAVSTVTVIALAAMLTYLAQVHARRLDTTLGASQSLRPQTINYIRDLKQKVRLIALYPKLKAESPQQDYYQPIADLLNEYATKGRNVTIEMLDPDTQKEEFGRLVAEVTNRFGGEVKEYKAVTYDLGAQNDIVLKFAQDEVGQFRQLPSIDQVQDQSLQGALYLAYPTLLAVGREAVRLKAAVEADLGQQIPSYKDAVEEIRRSYSSASQRLDLFNGLLESLKSGKGVPKAIADYAPAAQARAAAAKKVIAAMLERIQHLPPLKELDEFRDQLKSKSILVMTDTGYKIVQFDQVWTLPQSSRYAAADSAEATPRFDFAGEQQITAAIVTLTSGAKPMVVFVRMGGAPLASTGGFAASSQQPPFAAVAQRLRDYNFDVRDKDISGQSPDYGRAPTEAQMKSAIWVVIRVPRDAVPGQPTVDPLLAEHLKEGGSGLALAFPTADDMSDVLSDWGLQARTDYLMVHEALPPAPRRTTDMVDAALQSSQVFFKLNEYGNHPICQPLQGLDFVTAVASPVIANPTLPPGETVTPLLPFPLVPHAWASADPMAALTGERTKLTFNPAPDATAGRPHGDLDNTADRRLYGAAAAQRAGGGRLLVVGSYWFATNDPVELSDVDMMEKHNLNVARLPGNGEFFVNGIFWLAHMDEMLAISPHTLQVARIEEMSQQRLAFWRIGVLTAGLPAAVIVAGLLVYVRRRD